MASPVSWICTDDRTSIGTNTANSNHEAICLFFVSFTLAKVRINEQEVVLSYEKITFFTLKYHYYYRKLVAIHPKDFS